MLKQREVVAHALEGVQDRLEDVGHDAAIFEGGVFQLFRVEVAIAHLERVQRVGAHIQDEHLPCQHIALNELAVVIEDEASRGADALRPDGDVVIVPVARLTVFLELDFDIQPLCR